MLTFLKPLHLQCKQTWIHCSSRLNRTVHARSRQKEKTMRLDCLRMPALSLLCAGLLLVDAKKQSLRRMRRDLTVTRIGNYFERLDSNEQQDAVVVAVDVLEEAGDGSFTQRMQQLEFSMQQASTATPTTLSLLQVLTTVTPESQLLNTATPQGKAYQFLMTEKPHDDPEKTLQKYALATLYYSTAGDSWTKKIGWLMFNNECEWAMVVCHEDTGLVRALMLCKFVPLYGVPAKNGISGARMTHANLSHSLSLYSSIPPASRFSRKQLERRTTQRDQSLCSDRRDSCLWQSAGGHAAERHGCPATAAHFGRGKQQADG